MLSENKIKLAIVTHAMEHIHEIYDEFYFEDNVLEERRNIKDSVTSPANWVEVDSEETLNGDIEILYDCEPLDDQLRAYVLLDHDQNNILNIEIIGE